MLAAFRAACARHGSPASTLTDNGLVFTTRFAGGKGGRNALEAELRRLGIRQKNGKRSQQLDKAMADRLGIALPPGVSTDGVSAVLTQ